MRAIFLGLLLIAASLTAGCGLFGKQPEDHTAIDYESLEPGQGAESVGGYPYGHTGTTHSGTGVEEDEDQ